MQRGLLFEKYKLNLHFAVQYSSRFNPDAALPGIRETFYFFEKISKPLAGLSRSETEFFIWKIRINWLVNVSFVISLLWLLVTFLTCIVIFSLNE